MILVAMGYSQTLELLLVLDQKFDIGQNQIDPDHLVGRKSKSCIHQHHIVTIDDGHGVFADLTQSTDGNYFEGVGTGSIQIIVAQAQKKCLK